MASETGLMPIQQAELNRALRLLQAFGCKYCVITPGGATFGDLKVSDEPVKRRKALEYPYGTVSNFLREAFNFKRAVGDVFVLDPKEYGIQRVQSTLGSMLIREWGHGTYVTQTNNGMIAVLRTADAPLKGDAT